MIGKLETPNKGIITRTLDDIFNRLELETRYSYTISLSYLQIYTEMVL